MDLLIDEDKRDKDVAVLLGVKRRTITHRIWVVCNKFGVDTRVRAAVLYDRMRR
jgi:DNA-binding NarL/FixJ family response regulator